MPEPPGTRAWRLVWSQIRYQNRVFWRSPVGAFFTLVLPLLFLVLLRLVFAQRIPTAGGMVSAAQFFAPALAVFAAASATYTNLAVNTAIARDEGILKRIRGTPLPPWIYLAGRVGSAIWIALLGVLLMTAVGVVGYDLRVPVGSLPHLGLVFSAGVAAFALLGLAVAGLVPSGDAAPAVANATLLPVALVSDIFLPLSGAPRWLQVVGDLFPLKHVVEGFRSPFLDGPATSPWPGLLVVGLWGLVGLLVALRYFRWEPVGAVRRRTR